MNVGESESGYLGELRPGYVGNSMIGVEIIRVTAVNVIARGQRYGRQWLLKGLREELRDSTAMRKQLMKEFEIHSRLRHPAIVQAIGLEEIDGLGPCIVEEWIEGKNLAQLIREGRLSKQERRRIMREIINATAYLHSKGVVHRDLKPSNIMVRDAGGEAVIIDFGLADTDDYVELKQAAGTAGFISPEQMEAGGAQTSDDVYSLGVTMLELCPEYRRIAMKCTGPVGERPADGRALIRTLDLHDRRPRMVWATILGVIVLAAGGLGLMHIRTLAEASKEAERQVATITEENKRNAELANRLTDSLEIVSGRMKEAEAELKRVEEYNKLLEKTSLRGQRKIDDILKRYDKVLSKYNPEEYMEFNDKFGELVRELPKIVEDYCDGSIPDGVTESDRIQIKLDLHNYSAVKLSEYQKPWMKKIFPSLQQN